MDIFPSISTTDVVKVPTEIRPIFDQAVSVVRAFFGDVTIDPSLAKIEISGERYLLVRASGLSIDFFETLMQLYADRGRDEALSIARGFLFDIAHTIAMHDARAFHERMAVTDSLAKLSAGPVHFAFTGWAKVDIDGARSRPVPNRDYLLIYDHAESFEAHAYMSAGRTSDHPVCILGAGYSSGWCEASFGIDLTSVEVSCRARGDASCTFVMAPPDLVAKHIAEHFPTADLGVRAGGNAIPTYFERKTAEEDLRRSLEQLRAAQDELVRKERLATVGLLVSGVAHEVNTPLGVAVTATSVMHDELVALRAKFEANELTRADLRTFFEHAEQADRLSRSNLERAAELVHSFKRVAIDHASAERRRIDVVTYIRQTVDSLKPLARRAQLDIDIAGEPFEIETHPGVLAQLITNFVSNTAEHAARDGAGTPVRISIARSARDVTLVYEDRGKGMPAEVRSQAFQPFFTTRRGQGGTGLGLHIVQSLVVDVLRGKIALDSEPGRGTRFEIVFPIES